MPKSSGSSVRWVGAAVGSVALLVAAVAVAKWWHDRKSNGNSPSCSPAAGDKSAQMNKGIYTNKQMSAYQPSSFTSVVSGNEYAQQQYAGHQQYQPADPRYQSLPSGAACGMPSLPAVQTCGVAARPACMAGPEPAAYYPYSGGQGAAAFDSAYPNEEDMSSLAPRGCASSQQQAKYALNINSLMPASWRGNGQQEAAQADGSQWTKYAPSKEAFDRYITAQGSARLTLNTRNPLSRQIGIPDMLRQSPPVPLAAQEMPFNDSSFRLDTIYRQLGRYPTSTEC